MALTLPMETLSRMKVSFRVGLPDGTFAFGMAPGSSVDVPALQAEGGMKLHLTAVHDAGGITLTLCTSGPLGGLLGDDQVIRADAALVSDSSSPPVSGPSGPSLDYHPLHGVPDGPTADPDRNKDLEFVSYSQPGPTSPSEPLDFGLQNFPLEGFDSLDYLLDFQQGRCTIDDLLLDPSLNLQYNSPHNAPPEFNSNVAHFNQTDDSSEGSSPSDFGFTEETPATTPSACSSESLSRPNSPSMRPRGARPNLRCPEPACGRHFTSNYTLSKHVKAHEPKVQKSFPCSMGCSMRFSRKHDRLRHEVTQHGRVCEWGCTACLGFFSSESTLKKHKCRNPGATRWISDQERPL
ncbi:hypothetical protein FB451DRAFT_1280557 [Mycena latifolia]|nr:hypothetical protein FB451DRAFT_1280557 [Mycena latifolia]